jgi:hypothetical protein
MTPDAVVVPRLVEPAGGGQRQGGGCFLDS